MIRKLVPLLFVGLSFLLSKCSEEETPNYPIEPYIEFRSIKFTETPDVTEPDEIALTFYYRDGDSNLGLDQSLEYQSDPFHHAYFFRKIDGSPVTSDHFFFKEASIDDLIQYSDLDFPPYDTIPYVNKYDCKYWYYYENKFLYYQINENHFNILVKFFWSDNGINFIELDWMELICHTLNGRFPDLSEAKNNSTISSGPFTIQVKNNFEGKITYTIQSNGFKPLFGGKKLKISIQIKDRALNNSNIIETDILEL